MFWFLFTILSIPQFRHEIREFERREVNTIGTDDPHWDDYQFVSYMIFFPLLTMQMLAHIVSDKTPVDSRFKHIKSEKPSPELKASFVRKMLFLWFDSLTWRGYRKPLESEDMWDINPEDTSDQMIPRWDKYWKANVEKNRIAMEKKERKAKGKGTANTKTTKAAPKATHVSGRKWMLYKHKLNFIVLFTGKHSTRYVPNVWRSILLCRPSEIDH